jgi:hypothetical protein
MGRRGVKFSGSRPVAGSREYDNENSNAMTVREFIVY